MELAELLANEPARQSVARLVDEPAPLAQLDSSSPDALPARKAWEAAAGIGRLLGDPVVHAPLLGLPEGAWAYVTPAMAHALVDVTCRTAASSPLAHSMRRRLARGNFISPYIDEVRAGFAQDGIALDHDQLLPLVKGHRGPADDADQMFLNFYEMERELMAGAEAPTNADGLLALHEALLEHCPKDRAHDVDLEAIEAVAGLLDGSLEARWPLMDAITASAIIWQRRPFPQLNGAMEVLVRSLFSLACGLPALSCAPYAALGGAADSAGPVSLARETPFGTDATPYFLAALARMRRGLDALDAALAALDARDDALLAALDADFRLNHRQRATMARAATQLDFGIDVASYCEQHGVAVATARADLQKLVELDYLLRDHEAARILYRARPDLQTKVEAFTRKGR